MTHTDAKTKVVAALVALLIIVGTTLFVVRQFSSRPKTDAIVIAPTEDSSSEPIKRIAGPRGVVVNTEGRPVGDAEVLLAVSRSMVDVHGPMRQGTPMVRTDKDGRFAFGQVESWTDLVVRCEEGFSPVLSTFS